MLAVGSQVLASRLRIHALIVLWTRTSEKAQTRKPRQLLNVVVLITMGALVLRLQRIIWRSRSPAA